ncbi:MAG TPA: CPBP family intramembrane glutamic endopeptidase [Acetobacteraceae bacterium]|nr:CPBP family intramembrane glutamic endopeptidase [Acetobacteraceae bacterium]
MRDARDWRGILHPGPWLGARVFGWAVLLVLAVGGSGTLASIALHRMGAPKDGPGSVLPLAIAIAVMLAAYVLAVRFGEKRPVEELAPRFLPTELTAGFAGGIAIFTVAIALLVVTGAYTISAPTPGGPWRGLQLGFASGVSEELLFRGVLMRLLWEAFGARVALMVSSIVFGLMHLLNPDHNLMGAVAIIVEAGLGLGALYLLTGRLWANMGAHAGWNFAQSYLFGARTSGFAPGGHLFGVMPRPGVSAFFTGGEFGPEASMMGVLVGGTAGILLLLWARRRARAAWPIS